MAAKVVIPQRNSDFRAKSTRTITEPGTAEVSKEEGSPHLTFNWSGVKTKEEEEAALEVLLNIFFCFVHKI